MGSEFAPGLSKLHRSFPSTPPERITQKPFDSSPKHLSKLARLRPGDRAEFADLWEYAQDLLYSGEIQGALLQYVLPFCLKAWCDDLRGVDSAYGGFVEHFYPVLANKGIFDEYLTPTQTMAVSEFMRASIIEEIDDQRGLTCSGSGARPYRWITAVTTQGVLLSDVDQLWSAWWSIDTVGRAVAAVQYISCLMYGENDNPVFGRWTPESGGGPPSLWEFGGHLYKHHWLKPNADFLRRILSPQKVSDVLTLAVERLGTHPEHAMATEIKSDIPLCAETLTARCAELPALLETPQQPAKLVEWTR